MWFWKFNQVKASAEVLAFFCGTDAITFVPRRRAGISMNVIATGGAVLRDLPPTGLSLRFYCVREE